LGGTVRGTGVPYPLPPPSAPVRVPGSRTPMRTAAASLWTPTYSRRSEGSYHQPRAPSSSASRDGAGPRVRPLTVTSAGLTSPFKTPRQYKKFKGEEVEVLGKNGQKVTGILGSSNEEGFTLAVTKQVRPEGAKRKVDVTEQVHFAYDEVKHTKYLIRFK